MKEPVLVLFICLAFFQSVMYLAFGVPHILDGAVLVTL